MKMTKGDLTLKSCGRSPKHHGRGGRREGEPSLARRESTEKVKKKRLHVWRTSEGHWVCLEVQLIIASGGVAQSNSYNLDTSWNKFTFYL